MHRTGKKLFFEQKFSYFCSPTVLNAALELYLDTQARKREQMKKAVQQIRQEVEARGGLDEKDLEKRIREYRRAKSSKRA